MKIGFLFKVLMLKEFVFNLFKIFIVLFYVVNSYGDCFILIFSECYFWLYKFFKSILNGLFRDFDGR